jgi:hypothetical protein
MIFRLLMIKSTSGQWKHLKTNDSGICRALKELYDKPQPTIDGIFQRYDYGQKIKAYIVIIN